MCGFLKWIKNLFSSDSSSKTDVKPAEVVPTDSPVSRSPGKFALLVGIDNYNDPKINLMGCVTDVTDLRLVLLDKGFKNKNIRVITDDEATKNNILNLLEEMILASIPGDELVFHFSGHGSQIPDMNGDEVDKLDEVLIPYDFNWNGGYISDDAIAERFKKIPDGVIMSMISDSCHSGTISKDINSKTKSITPPAHILQTIYSVKGIKLNSIGLRTDGGPQKHILLTGCRSTQTSASAIINGEWHGVLTYYFIQSLKNNDNITWHNSYIYLLDAIGKTNNTQTPQLTGPNYLLTKPVFGGTDD